MTTFGDRLKSLRKAREMGQMELAEQIGVSVQSVSRWETGNCMPDIFQIVPLAKVLGTTADFLLGMDFSEEDELSKAYVEVNKITRLRSHANQTEGERSCDINKKCYEILAPLAARYPMNYTLLLRCCMFGSFHLNDIVKYKLFNYTEKEINTLYNDLERMLSTVVAYEKNLGLKGEAKERLVCIHCIMGYYGKAEMEAEDLGYDNRYKMLYEIASTQDKWNDQALYAKKKIRVDLREYYFSLTKLALAYSVQGKPMRDNAICVFNTTLELIESQREVFGESFYYETKLNIYSLLAKEYLRDNEIEKCIEYAEKLTDGSIQLYDLIKKIMLKSGGIVSTSENNIFIDEDNPMVNISYEEALTKAKTALKWSLLSCQQECEDNENNPIITSERFKKCLARLDALE